MRSIANQIRHDGIVARLALELCSKGYERVLPATSMDEGLPQPEKLYSEKAELFFSPDLYAEKAGVPVYFEVETEDSIDSAITRAELECFLAHARHVHGYFYLVVPEAIREKAAMLLREIDEKDVHRAFILTV